MTKIKGYKIDFSNNTITVNYKFHQAMQDPMSVEYGILKSIRNDFPTIKLEIKSGHNSKTPNVHKRFTYANMIKHMSCYKNSDELLEQFEIVKKLSKPLASPYKYVCDWFNSQFPEYKDCKVTMEQCKDKLTLVSVPNTDLYQTRIYA